MANMVLWGATWASRGTVMTTELNSLANATWATGAAFDNSSNLDQYGCLELNTVAGPNPAAGAYVILAIEQSADGTNYEDAPVTTTNPGYHQVIATMSFSDVTAAHRIVTPPILLPPGKFKVGLYNGIGVTMATSNNTVTLYTANSEVQ